MLRRPIETTALIVQVTCGRWSRGSGLLTAKQSDNLRPSVLGIFQIVLALSGFGLILSADILFHSVIRETNERLEPSMRFSSQDARPRAFQIMAAHRVNCPDSHLRKVVWMLTAAGFACGFAAFFLGFAR